MAFEAAQTDQEETQEQGSVTELVKEVNDSLMQLSDILNNSQGATDKDRAQMAQIMGMFQDLADKKLSQEPGVDEAEPEAPMAAQAPAEGGLRGVPMGPQSRM